jgi:hypothetical protein
MKILLILVSSSVLFLTTGCYSSKSLGDPEKADKYLFVY